LTENQPVTRLDRIIQQLRSFADTAAGELEAIGSESEGADLAVRVRALRDTQRQQVDAILQELIGLQDDLVAGTSQRQESEAEPLPEPISRRELFERVANPGGDEAASPEQ
jgi:hypothetical protein